MQSEAINNSLQKLIKWLEGKNWKGYDPYDIKGLKFIISITALGNRNKFFAIFREVIFELLYTFPVFFRKFLGVKPKVNAKAMGLFAKSFIDLYKLTENEEYKYKADECLKWLLENKKETNTGYGWGYPFNWQSAKFIPAFTPNGIVTTSVGDAFWTYYKMTGEKIYLKYCIKIAGFLYSLPKDIINNNICFSYTPLFTNHVHNLNLFVAEFLIKIGIETGNQEWITAGNSAVSYTLADQRNNGSFDYNGPPEKPQNLVDNYHTGFVLRMLHSVWLLTQRDDVYESLSKCYTHYISNFFEDNELPKFTPERKYRIDIHSSAESVNCLSELSVTFPDAIDLAQNILLWTIKNLQDKNGYFYYGIFKSRFTGFPYVSKIAYIRWSQAWMLKAITNYLKFKKNIT